MKKDKWWDFVEIFEIRRVKTYVEYFDGYQNLFFYSTPIT